MLAPEAIDEKRRELKKIAEELGKMSEQDVSNIEFAKVVKLKQRADALNEELQKSFKGFMA